MADWLVEEGIGEDRAILLDGGTIVAARLNLPGGLSAGLIEDAQLISRTKGSRRGTARFANGEDALVSQLPKEASEGSIVRLEVTRAAITEGQRSKLAQARPTTSEPRPASLLSEQLASEGRSARIVRRFPVSGWSELAEEALSGVVEFNGGKLFLYPTPAMTLIDIDGTLPPRALALAAVPAIADSLRRLDIGGSIGIDFPTLSDKADRRAVDDAIASALSDWPHERTSMNGFGFVQIVARLTGPSLLQRFRHDRHGAAARLLLRKAESVTDPGQLLLTCHPLVRSALKTEWLDELARRTGREIRVQGDAALAPEAGFAQSIQP